MKNKIIIGCVACFLLSGCSESTLNESRLTNIKDLNFGHLLTLVIIHGFMTSRKIEK